MGADDQKPVFLPKSQRLETPAPLPPRCPSIPLAPAPAPTPTPARSPDRASCARSKKRRFDLRFRFCADWDASEDTSRTEDDALPLHSSTLLFGRGLIAGIDRPLQKRLASARSETRHWSHKPLHEMTERDWRIFREDLGISFKGALLPCPMRAWAESSLLPDLLEAVRRAGYESPTPIQMASIPLGLHGRDVIGVAETGSGKTAAFLLPMLDCIARLTPATLPAAGAEDGPLALVLAPTRELALQIEREANKLARSLGIRVVSIVGGQSIERQGLLVQRGCDVMIATPGRLLDCLDRRYVVLNRCNYVVLDEADRMIDMGFETQVVGVLDAMPSSNLKPENEEIELLDSQKSTYRTTYMFSATMPPLVERLARKYMRNPVTVTVGSARKATELITQRVIMLKESEKMSRLHKLLDGIGDRMVIVFVNTRRSADTLAKDLDRLGYRATTFHGGKGQEQREISLDSFTNGRFNVLVATDVAGRGIDIPDVAHVVNFDMPKSIEAYTHRIGRTGRAGRTGVATTFLTMQDTGVFYDIKQMLIQSNSPVPPELARHEASRFKPGMVPDRPARHTDTVFTH